MRFSFLLALGLLATLSGHAMRVFVQTPTGQVLALEVEGSDRVATVKQEVQDHAGIPVPQQLLLFGGQPLGDDGILADYGVQEGSTLRLVWRFIEDPAVKAAGGGTAAAGPDMLRDTVGQPVVGRAQSASYTLAEGFWSALGSLAPLRLAITNPPATPHLVTGATLSYAVAGEAIGLAGTIGWANRLTLTSGTLVAAAVWRIEDLCLAVGDNLIIVSGTNAFGETALATVSIQRPAGWANRPPVAQTLTITRRPSVPAKIRLTTLATRWNDPDGHAVRFGSADATSTNGVPVWADGTFLFYQAGTNQSQNVTDTFTYTIREAPLACLTPLTAVGTIVIEVEPPPTVSLNIVSAGLTPEGNTRLTFAGIPGQTYRVQRTFSLSAPVFWTSLTNNVNGSIDFAPGPDGLWTHIDLDSTNHPERYYRSAAP
jgi:hypothetical protein